MFKISRHGLGAAVCGRICVFLARIAGPRAPCRRLVNDRSGATAITVALMASALLGITGLTLDVGDWYGTRSAMQSATDAAALGGAVAMFEGDNQTQIIAATTTDAGLNDTSGLAKGATLTVDVDMNNNVVTATMTKTASLLLSGLFLRTAPTISVTAKAGLDDNGSPVCLLITDPNGSTSLTGSAGINAGTPTAGCDIVDNSTAADVMHVTGSATVDAQVNCGPGGPNGYGTTGSASFNPTATECAAIDDPLASWPVPPEVNQPCTYTNLSYTGSKSATLSPGVYCGGLSLTGSATFTLQPGIYVFRNGPLKQTGSGGINGTSGVSLYFTGTDSYLDLTGSGTDTIVAPTTGAMAGIAVYQDSSTPDGTSADTNTLTGSGGLNLTGTLYFGHQTLNVTGSGTINENSPFTSMVVYDLNYKGSGTLDLNSNYSGTSVPRLHGLSTHAVSLLQ